MNSSEVCSDADKELFVSDLSEVEVGMRLEASDKFGWWYTAKVVKLDRRKRGVLVHFEGWNSRFDEFIPIGGERLRHLSKAEAELKMEPSKVKDILIIAPKLFQKYLIAGITFACAIMLDVIIDL